jgi:predicted nucleotide-binding protein
MPARSGQTSNDPPSPAESCVLKIPPGRAESELMERIQLGRELADMLIPNLKAARASAQRVQELEALRSRYLRWRAYNQTWLDRNLGGEAAQEYRYIRNSDHYRFADNVESPGPIVRFLVEDIESEILILQSVQDRLPLWAPKDDSANRDGAAGPARDGPIFIVHGSDTLRAERVARTVKEATGRQTVILREQASLGRTLIEKFEHNAASVSYAIVVLTPDDEGGRTRGERQPRARQNVILEMGYFYGLLGRGRVSILLSPGVEKPSDMDGIVYIGFDDNGGWRTELFRELEHAGIHVDMSRAF